MSLTPQVTVTANLQQITGSLDAASATFELEGFGNSVPRVPGTTIIVQTATTAVADGSGNISVTLWGLDVITPAGCFYTVTFFNDQGGFVASLAYDAFIGSGTFDLSQVTPRGETVIAPQAPNAAVPQVFVPQTHQFLTGMNSTGAFSSAQPAFSDLSGTLAAAQLPNPTATTLGGVKSFTPVTHQFVTGVSTSGVVSAAQPAFTDISGTVAATQLPNPSASSLGGIQSFASQTSKWINAISTSGVPSATQPSYSDLASGAVSATTGAFSDILVVTGNASLPASTGGSLRLAGFSTPVAGRLFFGDGSGWQLMFSKRSSSVTTDLFTFTDNGNLSVTGQYQVSGSQITAANLANGVTGSGAVVLATSATLTTPHIASIVNTGTLTLPTSTDTLVGRATTDTLTNKTIGSGGLAGLTVSKQIFTSSGTLTISSTSLKVTVIGGGGGGGGTNGASNASGTGGGAGGCAIKWLTGLTPGNTLTVTVGAGGTGVSNAAGNGGTASSVASGTQTISTISGNGGGGGAVNGNIVGDVRGTATGGDLNYRGGQPIPVLNSTSNAGGVGGTSIFGGIGIGGFLGAGGAADTNSGSGGGGAGGGAGTASAGGNGAAGVVIFEWMV